MQMRRCTQSSPVRRHSSQPRLPGARGSLRQLRAFAVSDGSSVMVCSGSGPLTRRRDGAGGAGSEPPAGEESGALLANASAVPAKRHLGARGPARGRRPAPLPTRLRGAAQRRYTPYDGSRSSAPCARRGAPLRTVTVRASRQSPSSGGRQRGQLGRAERRVLAGAHRRLPAARSRRRHAVLAQHVGEELHHRIHLLASTRSATEWASASTAGQ